MLPTMDYYYRRGKGMPRITLNIDRVTLGKIVKAAEKERTSISEWISKNLKMLIRDDYPAGYFDLFGSICDDTFVSPRKQH